MRKSVLEYFERSKEELGQLDETELLKLCPSLLPNEDRIRGDGNSNSIAQPNTANPIFHVDSIEVSSMKKVNQRNQQKEQSSVEVEVDSELLTHVRTTFLQVGTNL